LHNVFFTIAKKLFFTIGSNAQGAYAFGKQINRVNNVESKAPGKGLGLSVSAAPGISYRLSDRFLFDASLSNLLNLSYTYSEIKYNTSATTTAKAISNSLGVSTSLSNTNLGNVGLGFRWLLAKK
jgi:hypothetical protein